ncbi:hypothetical protein F5887DRAFT_921056 [Amanita rubescens]|nr:hypothetical protein F5887DRAFT_921056 [Amanita rubescens]
MDPLTVSVLLPSIQVQQGRCLAADRNQTRAVAATSKQTNPYHARRLVSASMLLHKKLVPEPTTKGNHLSYPPYGNLSRRCITDGFPIATTLRGSVKPSPSLLESWLRQPPPPVPKYRKPKALIIKPKGGPSWQKFPFASLSSVRINISEVFGKKFGFSRPGHFPELSKRFSAFLSKSFDRSSDLVLNGYTARIAHQGNGNFRFGRSSRFSERSKQPKL